MRILIFGKGQLGNAYQEYFGALEGWKTSFAEGVDIRNPAAVGEALDREKPDVALNAAAKTNIDWCEENQLECFDINTRGADMAARECQKRGVYLVHISSGCVQESKTANDVHTEEDAPNPLCFYSWTKVWAENLLMDRLQGRGIASDIGKPLRVLILRPRQLLSSKLSPRNALVKMLTYTKFVDTPNSCTVIEDLMRATRELVDRGATGIYNVANLGVTTPYEIAGMLREQIRQEMSFEKISKEELNRTTRAKRIDCVLSIKKLELLEIKPPEIHGRLREVILELKKNLEAGGREVLQAVEKETKEKLNLK
ncbi:MAG: sugar nucleotide-binding protein [Patescibacteria group bacterium]